jgi:cytochrome c-type biogenesis protein CcmH/NrfG
MVALDPRHVEARYALADALTRAGKRAPAIEQWKEVTRLQPRRAVAWSNLGAVLLLSKRTREAEAALATAARLEPGDRDLTLNLAAVRYQLALEELAAGRSGSARDALRRALAGDPRLATRAHGDSRLKRLLED